jgi:hypothetical protein
MSEMIFMLGLTKPTFHYCFTQLCINQSLFISKGESCKASTIYSLQCNSFAYLRLSLSSIHAIHSSIVEFCGGSSHLISIFVCRPTLRTCSIVLWNKLYVSQNIFIHIRGGYKRFTCISILVKFGNGLIRNIFVTSKL